jgi:hypothetical protein
MKIAFDIEANGLQLDADTVHCIVAIDVVNGNRWLLYTKEHLDWS